MIQKLYIPFLLPGLNQILSAARISRKVRSGRRIFRIARYDDEKEMIEYKLVSAIQTQGIKPVDAAYLVFIHIEKNKRRDPNNVRGGAEKYVWDALQAAGIIENDGWNQDLGTEHEFHLNKFDPGLIVVIISGSDAANVAAMAADATANDSESAASLAADAVVGWSTRNLESGEARKNQQE